MLVASFQFCNMTLERGKFYKKKTNITVEIKEKVKEQVEREGRQRKGSTSGRIDNIPEQQQSKFEHSSKPRTSN